MRYLRALLATALFCAVALASQPAAAEIIQASPQMVRKGQFAMSFNATWMAQQEFKRQDSYNYRNSMGERLTLHEPTWDFKIKNDQYYMMKFAYGIMDRLNVYAKLGVVTGGKLESNRLYQGGGSGSDTEKLKTNFVWALGLEGKVIEYGDNDGGLVLGIEYLRYDDRKLSYDSGSMAPWMASDEGSVDYWQVDVSAIFYVTFPWFTPYIGIAYTYSETSYDLKWAYNDNTWEGADFTLKDKDPYMPMVGAFIPISPHFTMDLQATFVARTAGTLSLSYYF
ncbi:MAG: hypothetical protein ABIK12_12995 [Pseudomonadota bacterium]